MEFDIVYMQINVCVCRREDTVFCFCFWSTFGGTCLECAGCIYSLSRAHTTYYLFFIDVKYICDIAIYIAVCLPLITCGIDQETRSDILAITVILTQVSCVTMVTSGAREMTNLYIDMATDHVTTSEQSHSTSDYRWMSGCAAVAEQWDKTAETQATNHYSIVTPEARSAGNCARSDVHSSGNHRRSIK